MLEGHKQCFSMTLLELRNFQNTLQLDGKLGGNRTQFMSPFTAEHPSSQELEELLDGCENDFVAREEFLEGKPHCALSLNAAAA